MTPRRTATALAAAVTDTPIIDSLRYLPTSLDLAQAACRGALDALARHDSWAQR